MCPITQMLFDLKGNDHLNMYVPLSKCHLLYSTECWAITQVDTSTTHGLDQQCLQRLLGIRWHKFISNVEVWQISEHPLFTLTIA